MKVLITFSVVVLLAFGAYGQTYTPTPSDEFDCPNFEDALFPDPKDCSKYFVCTNGLAWHESCPPPLLFDAILLECGWAHEVQCGGSGTPPVTTIPTTTTTIDPSPSPPTTSDTQPPSSGPTDDPITTEVSDQPSTTEVSEQPSTDAPPSSETTQPTELSSTTVAPPTTPSDGFKCPSPDGTFSHPTDCTKYYICDGGVPTEQQCPDGLYWDDDLKVCNWPDAVFCEHIRHAKFGNKVHHF